ncbi:recombinase family protein [Paenibacillus dokdonensis]|uniref:Recombinase family protein n=1 Tax=Paenibacillus dokdonensis TaxID=2567944 RepID=A0ABU6GRP1_9BACL|nr:recombinase family protein [Paenibacillus dokdonensis]MEC0242024.1 recombinase family protein [Paenibacillus dokdonensis]
MKVFAYPRVSTDEQAEKGNSLFEQQERIAAYCKAMGWDDPIFFIEDGYSAKNTNRPKLTEMLDRIKGEPDGGIVITTKLDRLSRKLFDILKLNEYFNKYNYNYVSATEGFDTSTPAGRLVLQMLGMVAEFERERISERVKDNMLSLAKSGKRIITRPCYGYDIIDGKYFINIEESLISKKMAIWALKGEGSRSIAWRLNFEEGVKTKEGNMWSDKVVREYLQRETLAGDLVYNKTKRVGSKIVKTDPSEWVVVKDHHDPILTHEDHDKIIELFQSRKQVGKHFSNETYLLSGLVVCGHCAHKMNGKMNRSFSKRLNQENLHYQYLCDGYLKKAICYHHYAKRDDLESLIIERIKEIAKASPGSLKLMVSKPESTSIDKESIRSKLAKLDKKMQKQIDAFNDDLITSHDLKIASQRVNEERQALTKMLEESESDKEQQASDDVRKKAKNTLNDVLSIDRLKSKQAIRQLIEKIEITNGSEVRITWRGY